MPNPAIEDARRKVEQEYEKFREQFGRVLEAVQRVSTAGPMDDVYEMLEHLEDVTKEVRSGGMLGSGTKSHRKALERYRELAGGE